MELYTFILEFRGGTYITQFSGGSLTPAFKKWVNGIRFGHVVPNLREKTSERLDAHFRETKPVPLKGCKSVFSTSALVGRDLALVNVVRTH